VSGAQRVLITGAGSGIGLAIAEQFLEAGARVHIADISADALAKAKVTFPALSISVADVGDPASVENLFREALAALGGLDVLVNNCGIAGPAGPLEECSISDWDRCITVNLSGMFYCLRQAVPVMKAQRSGVILNVSTTSARTGLPNRLPYVASKVGVLGLSHNVARELGPWNIRCNAILPGLMDNPRGRGIIARLARERGTTDAVVEADFLAHTSMRTWIQMSEVGEMAVFLASDRAKHITAQQISVDGNAEWES
jgi:NAD(P)-dependent dehydrogenase (short-subunit alcohol dehydrogenase family)